jgi:hypothetical protein
MKVIFVEYRGGATFSHHHSRVSSQKITQLVVEIMQLVVQITQLIVKIKQLVMEITQFIVEITRLVEEITQLVIITKLWGRICVLTRTLDLDIPFTAISNRLLRRVPRNHQ